MKVRNASSDSGQQYRGFMNRLRMVAGNSPARTWLLAPPVRRHAAWVAQARFLPALTTIQRPWRVMHHLTATSELAFLPMRSAPITLVIRSGPGNLELLYEVFYQRCYLPPAHLMELLPPKPNIADLGANVGAFAAFCLSTWPDASLVCVEPDPDNLHALRAFVNVNGFSNIRMIEACAATGTGSVTFVSGLGSGSRIAAGGTPTPAIDTFPLLEAANFAKIDIEGGEWSILRDPRLATLTNLVLVMEYHRREPGDSTADVAAVALLEAAGFRIANVSRNYWGHGLIWAHKGSPSAAATPE